jgi:hypothetical protein
MMRSLNTHDTTPVAMRALDAHQTGITDALAAGCAT